VFYIYAFSFETAGLSKVMEVKQNGPSVVSVAVVMCRILLECYVVAEIWNGVCVVETVVVRG
jgi:hypothetical protein